jgi:uncharacterized membrane protein
MCEDKKMPALTPAQKIPWIPLTILAITLIGLALRLYQLDFQCLNVDEAYVIQLAADPTMSIIHSSLYIDCNPPLYYLAAHWSSVLLGGVSWFSIRIPAVIFGTLCIPLVYCVGKEMRGKTLGLLAAAAMAIMFPFFFYSQDARAYTLVLLAFLGFTLFYIKIVDGDTRASTLAGAGCCAALCLWSHYYSGIPLAIAGILLCINNRKLATFEVSVIAGILSAPMLVFLNIPNLLSRAAPNIFGYGYALGITPMQMVIFPQNMALFLPFELWSYACVIILPLAGYALWKYRLKIFGYFTIISLGSMAALVVLSHFTNTMPRYALLVSPMFLLMGLCPVAYQIDLQKSTGKKITLALLFLFLIFVFNIGSIWSWTSYNYCWIINGGS